jgi:hypothetical protein
MWVVWRVKALGKLFITLIKTEIPVDLMPGSMVLVSGLSLKSLAELECDNDEGTLGECLCDRIVVSPVG